MTSGRFRSGCHAVGCGALAADLAVRDIGAQLLAGTPSRVAVSAAPGSLEHDTIAGVQRRDELGRDHLLDAAAAVDHGARHGSVMAAGATLGGDEVPLAAMGKAHFPVQ